MNKNRYLIVGGAPFRTYTGTVTHTGLSIVASCNTEAELPALVEEWYNECSGLMLIIDRETGETV